MINLTIWIMLIIIMAALVCYAFIVESPVPYSEIVAIVLASVISWAVAILYASGNVVSEQISLVRETVIDNITTYEYDILQYPMVDGTVMALIITVAIGLTLYSLYILIPAVVDILNGGEDND